MWKNWIFNLLDFKSPQRWCFAHAISTLIVLTCVTPLSGCGLLSDSVDSQIYEKIIRSEAPSGTLEIKELSGHKVSAICVVNLAITREAENSCLANAVNKHSYDLDESMAIIAILKGGFIASGSLTTKLSKLEYAGKDFTSYCLAEPKVTYDTARVIGLTEVEFSGDLVSMKEACDTR